MNTPAHKLGWIKRRARRIQRFYSVSRRMAVHDAWTDWVAFIGLTTPHGGAA